VNDYLNRKKSVLFLLFGIVIFSFVFLGMNSSNNQAIASNSAYYDAIQADLPIAYWRTLASGQILDETSYNNDITSGIGTAASSSPISPILNSSDPKSINFNGNTTSTKGIITPITILDLTNWGTSTGWTWEVWATTTTVNQTSQELFSFSNTHSYTSINDDQWSLGWFKDKYRLTHDYGGSSQSSMTAISSPLADKNVWHHYVFSVSSSSAKAYLDGQPIINYTGTQPTIQNDAVLALAAFKGWPWPTCDYYSLKGKMSEIALYDYPLSPIQIQEHYELGKYGLDVEYPTTNWTRSNTISDPIQPTFSGDATGWEYEIASGYTLPDGLAIDEDTGQITGTPIGEDEINTDYVEIKVKATKGSNSILSNPFDIVVHPESPSQQFRPVLRFDEGEDWRPLDVNNFLAEEYDSGEIFDDNHTFTEDNVHQICEDYSEEFSNCHSLDYWENHEIDFSHPDDEDLSSEWPYIYIQKVGESIPVYSAPAEKLDNCETNLNDCDSGPDSSIYWHEAPNASGYTLLDYWIFYRYNQYAGGDHEGDWEEVVVAYSGNDPYTFDWVGMSSHGPVYRFLRGVLTCGDEEADPGSCGSEENPNILNQSQRPHIFISDGGHSNYPKACSTGGLTCGRVNGEFYETEKDYGGEDFWGNNNSPEALKEIDDETGWDGLNNEWWGDWNGHWGNWAFETEHEIFSPGAAGRSTDIYNNSDGDADDIPCNEFESDENENCPSELRQTNQLYNNSFITRACAPWSGPNISISICQPKQLQTSIKETTLDKKGSIEINDFNKAEAIASAPGITQVLGDPLGSEDIINIEYNSDKLVSITIKTSNNKGTVSESYFNNVDLDEKSKIKVQNAVPIVVSEEKREKPDSIIKLDNK
jgi:hypothetical protein